MLKAILYFANTFFINLAVFELMASQYVALNEIKKINRKVFKKWNIWIIFGYTKYVIIDRISLCLQF